MEREVTRTRGRGQGIQWPWMQKKVIQFDTLDEEHDLKVKESRSKWDRSKIKMVRLPFKNA